MLRTTTYRGLHGEAVVLTAAPYACSVCKATFLSRAAKVSHERHKHPRGDVTPIEVACVFAAGHNQGQRAATRGPSRSCLFSQGQIGPALLQQGRGTQEAPEQCREGFVVGEDLHGKRKITLQQKRLLLIRWCGGAWNDPGCGIEADSTNDENIQPQGLQNYSVNDID